MASDRNKVTYTIDLQNNIAAHGVDNEEIRLAPGVERFRTESELDALATGWPSSRLLSIWDRLPGTLPVKKFTNRKTAVQRIWKRVQNLSAPEPARRDQATKTPRTGNTKRPIPPSPTKSEIVLALLRQPAGATLQAIMAATGWQAHSVRGFISGQLSKKMRLKIRSFKRDGQRVYAIRS